MRIANAHLALVAETFWREAGPFQRWPCDLERVIALTFRLAIITLPSLNLQRIENWLEKRGTPYEFPCENRHVRGCIVAYRGSGLIFIDGSDPIEERRFTLAHEVAHFLLDYYTPRESARARLGDGILEVLDGLRPPTIDERIEGVLSSISIAPYVHLMEQRGAVKLQRATIWQAENRADELALEILAPVKTVYSGLAAICTGFSYFACFESAKQTLIEKYGLPKLIAHGYAQQIAHQLTGGPSVLFELGLE
ncbi:ImmA/IrrE family metallo-endopeptidase [candidate division KSB1 bacterium]|nr:ImmA/IrrE family metallo-endopeptidase [candidate division KSB1 bacterium]